MRAAQYWPSNCANIEHWTPYRKGKILVCMKVMQKQTFQWTSNCWSWIYCLLKKKRVTNRNRVKYCITKCNTSCLSICVPVGHSILNVTLTLINKYFTKKCYSSLSHLLLITLKSENEQKPVLISVPPPQKIREKKTPYWEH